MMNIFVGTAGFSYKDWEGVFYPADLKKRKIHPLEYLAQSFSVIDGICPSRERDKALSILARRLLLDWPAWACGLLPGAIRLFEVFGSGIADET
jgi:hypothetical protein